MVLVFTGADGSGSETITGDESGQTGPVDNGETVILTPSFSFQCSGEGLFPHSSDCAKFWLCVNEGQAEIESQLYLCPDDYLVS